MIKWGFDQEQEIDKFSKNARKGANSVRIFLREKFTQDQGAQTQAQQ